MSAPRRGLFGGTFDPPHIAHVALARAALDTLALEAVHWVPAGDPWQKARTITPAADREAMVRLAIDGEPRFVLDRVELERAGPSYTIDTVRTLQGTYPGVDWFLIIGADQYVGMHTWREWPELLQRVTLAVAQRPGATDTADAAVRQYPYRTVPLPLLDVAATEIRERVASRLPIDHMVPSAVARYIAQHGLYRRS